MAKRQELILNTGKLSGLCGRLMCCLGYEYNEAFPEVIALAEEDSPLPEDTEMFEIVVASGEPSEEADETEAQPHVTESQQPLQPKEQEHKESFRKSTGHRRKRRKRSPKK
jgi:cell fate regulator YaaT (PSP1 superfamily)